MTTHAHRFIPLLALALSSASVHASEHGLWFSLQSLPRDFEVELEGGGSNEESFDSAGRLGLGYRYRGGTETAFVISTGLAFSSEEFEDTEIGSFGVLAEPGISFRFGEGLGFELDVVVPFGVGVTEITGDSSGDDDESGTYSEIGLIVKPGYQFPNGMRVHADIGIFGRQQVYDIEVFEEEYELTVSSSGFLGGLGLGYTF